MKDHRVGAPVFVKVDEYKEILDVVDMIKDKMDEIRKMLQKMSDLRNHEDAEVSMWSSKIEDIDKRIGDIDRMMFEPE